jgi:hypothetical protein
VLLAAAFLPKLAKIEGGFSDLRRTRESDSFFFGDGAKSTSTADDPVDLYAVELQKSWP